MQRLKGKDKLVRATALELKAWATPHAYSGETRPWLDRI